MKNINTYEAIKNELVMEILEYYRKYKDILDNFYNKIKSGQDMYVLSTTTPISEQTSANRSVIFATKNHTDNETFKWKMENLSQRFDYMSDYTKKLEEVSDARNNLLAAVRDLSVLNNITSNKKTGINVGHEIFRPIKKRKINKNLEILFRSMETLKWQIESYVVNEYNSNRRDWFVTSKNDSYVINDEKIKETERNFFDDTLKAIRHDLDQVEQIENRIESRNFLKYYLLFK